MLSGIFLLTPTRFIIFVIIIKQYYEQYTYTSRIYKIEEMGGNTNHIIVQNTDDKIVCDLRQIIEQGRKQAYASVNQAIIQTYWNIGRRIVEEEQDGEKRAKYGKRLIANLAEQLSPLYGNSYSKRNLDNLFPYLSSFVVPFKEIEPKQLIS